MRIAYYVTAVALALAALFPGGRTWGLDAWAQLPRGILALLAGVAAVAPFAGCLPGRRSAILPRGRVLPMAVLAGCTLLFFALRARAGFLGDGWQSLALLAEGDPMPKASAPATWLILSAVRGAIGGDPERAAWLAYRATSIGAGIAFLAAVWFLGGRLVPSAPPRVRFLLVMASGGWTLQFFGYPENYALFLAAVTAYALAGALAAREGRGRGLAVAFAAAAISLHGLGLLLLPSLAWLLARPRFAAASARGRRRLAALAAAVVLVLAGLGAVFLARDLALRLLFVPPLPTRLGAPGYTWLSRAHLLDLANLAILLVPGLAVLVAARGRRVGAAPSAPRPPDPARGFVQVLAATAWVGVFLLDPKLGMPRDWDVFAFAGPPLAIALLLPLAARAAHDAGAARAMTLAAVLGALVLLPRAATNADEASAYREFRRRLALDPARGRSARQHAVDYLRRLGAEDLARRELAQWDADYPERLLAREARDVRARGDLEGAIRLNREAIARAPDYADPWNNLGSCLLSLGRYEEARAALETARALNPGLPAIWLNLGTLCLATDDLDGAERWWTRAWRRTPDDPLTNKMLARLAQRRGDEAAYERHLARSVAAPGAPPALLREWGDHLEARGRPEEAAAARREAARRETTDEGRTSEGTTDVAGAADLP